jgi:hypothetical protein
MIAASMAGAVAIHTATSKTDEWCSAHSTQQTPPDMRRPLSNTASHARRHSVKDLDEPAASATKPGICSALAWEAASVSSTLERATSARKRAHGRHTDHVHIRTHTRVHMCIHTRSAMQRNAMRWNAMECNGMR